MVKTAHPCLICGAAVSDYRPKQKKICLSCARQRFIAHHGVEIVNWDQVTVATKGPRFGEPIANQMVRIRCTVCQAEDQKVISPKTLTNGHLARCTACATKARQGTTKPFLGRKHSEGTKSKMRRWWALQRVYGPERSTPIRSEIERVLGGSVINWSDITVTVNGNPPDYQDLVFYCQKCGCLSKQQFRGLPDVSPLCGSCMKMQSFARDDRNRYRSSHEVKLEEFLVSAGVRVAPNHTGLIAPYDLDLFLPEQNLAIEVDGLWTHCEMFKDKRYHLMKTERCEQLGVRLIHVFEDEVVDRWSVVTSRLLSILGKQSGTKVGARECSIELPEWAEAMTFLRDNHLQGACQYTDGFGLYHQGALVALMTFSKARVGIGSKSDHWELLRFVVKIGYTVAGAASRLLRAFTAKHGPVPIHSFADRRWSVGGVYEKLGFRLLRTSPPNYWYLVNHRREHRFRYRKDRLIAQGFDASKTEHEVMFARKLYRIYDCGTLVYGLNC